VARTLEPAKPVGFAVAIDIDAGAHLHEMDVLPQHGRKGLGRALALRVAEWARAAGFDSLTLTTFRHIPWNGPFYARLGFREIPENDLGPELRELLAEEAKNGLDASKRMAMRLLL
jgi:GNAT superfamily N-acetyltransferase